MHFETRDYSRDSQAMACHREPEAEDCEESVLIELACGHTTKKSCIEREVPSDHRCEELVSKDLPCGHSKVGLTFYSCLPNKLSLFPGSPLLSRSRHCHVQRAGHRHLRLRPHGRHNVRQTRERQLQAADTEQAPLRTRGWRSVRVFLGRLRMRNSSTRESTVRPRDTSSVL